MKRTTTTTYNNRPFKRPRSANWVYRAPANRRPPRRVYTSTVRSVAPAATRGFTQNTGELKSFDQGILTFSFQNTGDFTNLIFPASGGDINQRIGRKLTVKSIYIKGRVAIEASQTLPNAIDVPATHARMIIFVDYQPNGATPSTTDLINVLSPSAQLNLGNRERFKVLCEKNYFFDPFTRDNTVVPTVSCFNRTGAVIKKYCKCNVEMVFSGATGSISDLKTGAIYMFWISSNVSPQACIFVGTTRVRYADN